jgi:hypothetical protein
MTTRALLSTTAALLFAAPLAAAPPDGVADGTAQAGWGAWYGCWVPMDGEAPADQFVCMLPGTDELSVRIATIEDGAIVNESVLHADGQVRPVDESGCTGSESAWFSNDGRRVFTRAELDCDGVRRVSTGVIGMLSEIEWMDAQSVTIAGQPAARTVRYRALPREAMSEVVQAQLPAGRAMAQEAARLDAAAPLDIDAVAEAAQAIDATALEALLGARQQGFGLNAKALAQLEERGVAPSTIDVMVALSYPSHFVVEERSSAGYAAAQSQWGVAGSMFDDPCYDPFYGYDRFRTGCSTIGYNRYYSRYGRYGYSPYGYDRYGWGWYGSGPIVIIQPTDPGQMEPRGGSMIKGRGYTAGERPSTGRAQPRSGTASRPESSAGASRPATTTSRPTTTTTSKPTTTSTSTGRTAKPKPGGGGDN